jgi:hypothetical protein
MYVEVDPFPPIDGCGVTGGFTVFAVLVGVGVVAGRDVVGVGVGGIDVGVGVGKTTDDPVIKYHPSLVKFDPVLMYKSPTSDRIS